MTNHFNANLQNGVNSFYQEKPAGDIDLVHEVRNSLLGFNLGSRIDAFDQNRFIREAVGKHSSVQQHLLNRFWTMQLQAAPVASIEERYCLIPNGTAEDWLRLFKAKVLPFIADHNLPVTI